MTIMTVRENAARTAPEAMAFATLVDALGEDGFGPALARLLNELCGADHFAAFRFGKNELREVAACCVEPERTVRDRVERYINQGWWKRDPAMTEAQRHLGAQRPGLIHIDLTDDDYSAMRSGLYWDVRDRLLLCGHCANADFGLSIVRADPHAAFASEVIEKVAQWAELLLAVLGKHASMFQPVPNVAQALTALEEIESCIASTGTLPRREAEVSARILYGLSSVGIALDLAVSEETVKTYRKRAYQRLAIGSERELLTWYLAQWSRWRDHRCKIPSSDAVH
ncbi:helix-turn-helix transcriptional regulator [Burkholderia sp. USMB20]|uniref:helix-turn-helix transcriptional regulator n=1 Tax=Burkholderia sp. USMB20 TaxID=1571773 RepID=UPI0005DF27CA|nr:helix-turn-helix transcriptional regulator [Burkholderia sp. USMB20]TGN95685.1 LuxR family transcriptional regulator [Burkholderia sp. USMB20]